MLVKDKLAGCCELGGELEDDDIISTSALRISLKVDEALDDYQMILPAKAQD